MSDRKSSLRFEKYGQINIPDWIKSEYEVVLVDFPKMYEEVPNPLNDSCGELSYPTEAFSKDGKLICFREKLWVNSSTFAPTYHHQGELSTEAFTHALCKFEDYSVEGVKKFISANGILLVPFFNSQKRFIDSRLHPPLASNDDVLRYENLYVNLLPESTQKFLKSAKSRSQYHLVSHLADAAQSIYVEALREWNDEAVIEGHGVIYQRIHLAHAVILSEYGRRYLCSEKNYKGGGIISYWEVVLLIRLLQKIIRYIICILSRASEHSFSSLRNTMKEYEKGEFKLTWQEEMIFEELQNTAWKKLKDYTCDESTSDFFSFFKGSARNNLINIYSESINFVSRCVFSIVGTNNAPTWNNVVMLPNPEDYLGDDIVWREHVSMLDSDRFDILNAQENFRHSERYVEGTYSAALCVQLLNTLNSSKDWKVCKNPKCRQSFKDTYSEANKSKKKRQGEYCSKKCSQTVRNAKHHREKVLIADAVNALLKSDKERFPKALNEEMKRIEDKMEKRYKELGRQEEFIKQKDKLRKRWKEKLKHELGKANLRDTKK